VRKEVFPGARPELQGYWARVRGEEREPPEWLPGHLSLEFKRRWLDGFDSRVKWEMLRKG